MAALSVVCDECGQRVEVDSARFAIIREFGDNVECRDHERRY